MSTPLIWLLNGPDRGQFVGASIQGAVGVAALVWALFQQSATGQGPADGAAETGTAEAINGGSASTGVRRPGGTGSGSATAERTGDATADGTDSRASTGVDYS